MANRRMFSLDIVDSDSFLDMPVSSQVLYFHLAMRGDDDGFIGNPKKIMRIVGASDDDIKVLIGKRFLLTFENGVIVIKHWLIHNYIRPDRYHETKYLEQKKSLEIKKNGSYTELKELGIPNGNQMDTEVRLGKVRLNSASLKSEVALPKDSDSFLEDIKTEEIDEDGNVIKQRSRTSKNKEALELCHHFVAHAKKNGYNYKTNSADYFRMIQVLKEISFSEAKDIIEEGLETGLIEKQGHTLKGLLSTAQINKWRN